MVNDTISVDVLDVYLTQMARVGIIPNFWCSREYLSKSGKALEFVAEGNTAYVREGRWCLFPPICFGTQAAIWIIPPEHLTVWSDFPGWDKYAAKLMERKVLDYEYIFDQSHFQHMDGGDWATFRKNCRKWPRDNPGSEYRSQPSLVLGQAPCVVDNREDIEAVLVSWLESLGEEAEVHDDEVMMRFLLSGYNRKFLYRADGTLMGVNVWDYNWHYINFRYSICRPDPYLAEYMRWLFYTDPAIANDTRKVNDGGSLDREGLRQFKLRMNPVAVREVCSWEWKQ